jgi:non-specific serine/threonine protein kinase
MIFQEKLLKDIPNNLPLRLGTFIGRKPEIARLAELLGKTPPACRLLTLTGVGGSGKTRLALEVAPLLLNNFPQGVWFVKLAALSDPQLIPQTVAQVLGLKDGPQSTPTDTLIEYLQNSKILLILDNCEHLIEACAGLAEALLQACPGLAILATSREGLNIEGEICFPVPSLSLPDPAAVASLDEIAGAEAVQLFLQRGAAVQPDFRLTEQNAAAIIQICQRLDGLPLALELAAGRLKGLPLNQLANRLDDRFRLLSGGSRTALPRHQTLQALLDWSYNLLSQREQVVFRRLSGFPGDFSLEAAEFICPGEYQAASGWGNLAKTDVLDLLAQLVNKSLVQLEPGASGQDEQRYRLLETIRHYSRDRAAEASETELIRQNHLEWCLELAEKAEPYLQGPDQVEWLNRLEQEHNNLRAALAYALEARDEAGGMRTEIGEKRLHPSSLIPHPSEAALRLCGALWRFWQTHSHFLEARRWLEMALTPAASNTVRPEVQAKALHGAGVLLSLNDYAASRAYHEENLNIRREMNDLAGQIAALRDLGWLALHYNDFERAGRFGEESLRLGQAEQDKPNIAASLFVLSIVLFHQGNLAESAKSGQQCLEIWRESGDLGSCASVLNHLGRLALRQGDYEKSGQMMVESLELNWKLNNKLGVANTILQITELSLAQPGQPAGTHRAVQLLSWQERLSATFGGKMPPLARLSFDASLSSSHSRLDDAHFSALWAEGQALTVEQAVSLAREAGLPASQLPAVSTEPPSPTELSPAGEIGSAGEKLTQREVEVLRLVAAGLTNAQIAEKMVVTSRTVNAHLTSIYAKLSVTSRSGAIRYALEHHLK